MTRETIEDVLREMRASPSDDYKRNQQIDNWADRIERAHADRAWAVNDVVAAAKAFVSAIPISLTQIYGPFWAYSDKIREMRRSLAALQEQRP